MVWFRVMIESLFSYNVICISKEIVIEFSFVVIKDKIECYFEYCLVVCE